MTKEELVEFLKENLRAEINYFSGNDWETKSLTVKLFLNDEEISSSTEYIYS